MKYWIINNSKFGYKNNSKEWSKNMIDYFENYFIPFLRKHAKHGDKLIHLGNIFTSSDNINIKLLLTVKNLFIKISNIVDVIIINGHNEKTKISELFKSISIKIIDKPENNFIPFGYKIIDNLPENGCVFLNNRIDKDVLKKYSNLLFFCGYHDDKIEEDNVIFVGAPYQFDNTTQDKGFFVVDQKSLKYKFIKNNYSPKYNTITITHISQIDDLDENYINKNKINIIVDKSLVDEKKIKLDVLLSKYNFKSIKYSNDVVKENIVDSTTTNIEELIREKIKNSENPNLISEFNNIMNIYKERY